MHSRAQALLEVGESLLLSAFEPYSLQFKQEYNDEIRRGVQAIRRATANKLARCRWQLNRNPFLFACLEFTDGIENEELIVGYGFRHGTTTKIEGIHRITGTGTAVGIPTNVGQSMLQFYDAHPQNELLLFHNHPRNIYRLLLDNSPLPSGDDRQTVEYRSINPQQLLRTAMKY